MHPPKTLIFFIVTMLSLVAWSLPSFGTTIFVPSEANSIQAGLDLAAPGDTVSILAGTYFEYDLNMKPGVTLTGVPDYPDSVLIDAQGMGRILDCDNLETAAHIQNITFIGGHTTEGWFTALGGAIRAQSSTITIENCIFENNTARIGAAVGASLSDISLLHCAFENNNATHDDWAAGGALWARDCTGVVENCQILNNTAFSTNPDNPGDGGGFFFNNTRLAVSHCSFQGNSTGAGAGGFYSVTNDSSVFQACEFQDNIAANGGAVYYEYGAAARFSDCTFTGNEATAGGAIVSFNDSFPWFENCDFVGNTASQWGGGALDCWDTTAQIFDCLFLDNSAQTHGGAINAGGSTVYLTGSIFVGNSALNRGGAVRAHYADLVVSQCTLAENAAPNGGGIHCGTSSTANVDRSIISSSTLGTSMEGFEEGFASISCSDFFGNVDGDWTGFIADQLGQENNFSADPIFCHPPTRNFTLSSNSPCAAEQQEICGNIGALAVACAPTPVEMLPPQINQVSGLQNFPNPFNPTTNISFTLANAAMTEIVIYDLAGHSIQTIHRGSLREGSHLFQWDGKDQNGVAAGSGIYFCQVRSADNRTTIRMALLK